MLSRVRLFAAPWTRARQAPLFWDSPGKHPGVGCHFLPQGLFLRQGSGPRLLGLLHWQADSLPLGHLGSPSQSSARVYYISAHSLPTASCLTQETSPNLSHGLEGSVYTVAVGHTWHGF